jgi:hypothetical protein
LLDDLAQAVLGGLKLPGLKLGPGHQLDSLARLQLGARAERDTSAGATISPAPSWAAARPVIRGACGPDSERTG